MNDFLLGAYWGARPDSITKCAQRIQALQKGLIASDPLMAEWFERSRSRKIPPKMIDVDNADVMVGLLLAGRNRRDVSGDIMDDLGYRVSWWNGRSSESDEAAISIHCGCTNDAVGNSIVINLPRYDRHGGWSVHGSEILRLITGLWQPDWAGLMSKSAMRERGFNGGGIFVDWMLSVPHHVRAVPEPGQVQHLAGGGSLIIVQPEPPSGSPEELRRIETIKEMLQI